jgi:hypothetical protein
MLPGMSDPNEIHHVFTYKTKLCLALPGDPPIFAPEAGTNCPKCRVLEAKYDSWRRKHLAQLEAERVSSKKSGT